MQNQKTLFISMLLLLSSPSYATMHPSSVASNSSKATMQCPSTDFHKFLAAFIDSIELQKAFTRLPKKFYPTVTYPVIPNATDRKTDRITLRVTELKNNRAKVILDKAETDYQLAFTFTKETFKKKACWQLIRIDDLSG